MNQAIFRKAYADVPFGQMHFAHSAGSGKPPLVLLGPAPRSWRVFRQAFPLLADEFHVIAPDPPCFGDSSAMPPDARMEDAAAGVIAVLDALGIERAHVYGHNTGRLLAAALAAEWPDRVDRLMIAGPTFTLIPEQGTRIDAIRAFIRSRYFEAPAHAGAPAVHPALGAWANTYRTMISPWWWDESLFATPDPEPVIMALEDRIIDELISRRTLAGMYRMNFEFDMAAALARVRARSLIIEITGGAADFGGFARQGPRLAERMQNASVITLAQTEGPISLFLLTGLAPMCDAIRNFLRA